MATFKKYTGNYIQMIDALKLPSNFYASNSKDNYDEQVMKDVSRTCYISAERYVAIIKRLQDTTHLYDDLTKQFIDANKPLSYSQGNFTAQVFSDLVIKTHPKYVEIATSASQEGTVENHFDSLGISYIDDDGKICGLTINYLRDDSNQTILANQRNRPFTVTVIKNTTLAPADREVIYFSHPDLLPKDVLTPGEDIDALAIPTEITTVINSKDLSQLLRGITTGDSVSLQHFMELNTRLIPGKNIDNRDAKITKLFEIIRAKAAQDSSASTQQFMLTITQMIKNSLNDINYFKHISMEDLHQLQIDPQHCDLVNKFPRITMSNQIKQRLIKSLMDYTNLEGIEKSKFSQNFASIHDADMDIALGKSKLSRNIGNFTLLGIALLTIISIALTLSGVFAPFGIAIAMGLATQLAVTGAIAASLIALDRGFKIAEHEGKLKGYQEMLSERTTTFKQQYDTDMAPKNDSYDNEIFNIINTIETTPTIQTTIVTPKEGISARPPKQRSKSLSDIEFLPASVSKIQQSFYAHRPAVKDGLTTELQTDNTQRNS